MSCETKSKDVTRQIYTFHGGVDVRVKELSIDVAASTPASVMEVARKGHDRAIVASRYLDVELYSSLYVVGPAEGFPVKVGRTGNIVTRLKGLQTSHWQKLVLHSLFWAPLGTGAAVEQEVIAEAKRLGMWERGEWLATTPLTAVEMVLEVSHRLGVDLFTSAHAVQNRGVLMLAADEVKRARARAA